MKKRDLVFGTFCFLAITIVIVIVYLVTVNFTELIGVIKKIPLGYLVSYALGMASTILSGKLMKARKASVK